MRAVTSEEIEQIAGGLKKLRPRAVHTATQTMPPVNVTATYIPPPSGGGGSGGAGSGLPGGARSIGPGAGHSGNPGDPPTETQQQLENAIEAAAKELEILARGGDPVASDLVSNSIDWSKITAEILGDDLAGGENSWDNYRQFGDDMDQSPEQVNIPINFSAVDWSKVPGASGATDFGAALQDLVNYAKSK